LTATGEAPHQSQSWLRDDSTEPASGLFSNSERARGSTFVTLWPRERQRVGASLSLQAYVTGPPRLNGVRGATGNDSPR
jgi:hypothetical protein